MLLDLDAPQRITCGGGKYLYTDDQQTPDTQVATFDFPHTCLMWEHRIWSKTGCEGEDSGITLYGEKGTLVFDKHGWHVIDGIKASDKAGAWEMPHLRNFLDCVKDPTRKLNADIEEGHKSTRLCQLGNIAWRTGRTLEFDGETETLKNDPEANKLLARTYRKLFELPTV
jgi:predicted dehydrogenase